ncbi:MAG: NADPH-dependent 7-cyano-7-deazaguanine reductase QueF [Planctomycetes bacterium]|nr:NADPH-dependent 7-cyano-7-deazaguanine reductase QueF [Planctomycetota bacterium]
MSDLPIEVFDNPQPGRDYVIEHTSEEFTSVCPVTGHPDFGTIVLRYVADEKCIELKSLKIYYQGFRNRGIYYEAVTNTILDDLVAKSAPRWMEIETHWAGRGGISSVIKARHDG